MTTALASAHYLPHPVHLRPVPNDGDLVMSIADLIATALTPQEAARLAEHLRIPGQDEEAAKAASGGQIDIGAARLGLTSMRLHVDGESIDLPRQEFQLLRVFVEHPNRVLTRSQLLDLAWTDRPWNEGRTVDVHVRRLRVKLGSEAARIVTIRGVGYRYTSR